MKKLWLIAVILLFLLMVGCATTGKAQENPEGESQDYPQHFLPIVNGQMEETAYEVLQTGLKESREKEAETAEVMTYAWEEPTLENEYCASFSWIKLEQDVVLEDVCIDMKVYCANGENWLLTGVYKEREAVYISFDLAVSSADEGKAPYLLLAQIPLENPDNYIILSYFHPVLEEAALWFTQKKQLDAGLFSNLQTYSNDIGIIRIDLDTKELEILEDVHNAVKKEAAAYLKTKGIEDNCLVSYGSVYGQEEMLIYWAGVSVPSLPAGGDDTLFYLYMAFQGNDMVDFLIEDLKTGEFLYGKP